MASTNTGINWNTNCDTVYGLLLEPYTYIIAVAVISTGLKGLFNYGFEFEFYKETSLNSCCIIPIINRLKECFNVNKNRFRECSSVILIKKCVKVIMDSLKDSSQECMKSSGYGSKQSQSLVKATSEEIIIHELNEKTEPILLVSLICASKSSSDSKFQFDENNVLRGQVDREYFNGGYQIWDLDTAMEMERVENLRKAKEAEAEEKRKKEEEAKLKAEEDRRKKEEKRKQAELEAKRREEEERQLELERVRKLKDRDDRTLCKFEAENEVCFIPIDNFLASGEETSCIPFPRKDEDGKIRFMISPPPPAGPASSSTWYDYFRSSVYGPSAHIASTNKPTAPVAPKTVPAKKTIFGTTIAAPKPEPEPVTEVGMEEEMIKTIFTTAFHMPDFKQSSLRDVLTPKEHAALYNCFVNLRELDKEMEHMKNGLDFILVVIALPEVQKECRSLESLHQFIVKFFHASNQEEFDFSFKKECHFKNWERISKLYAKFNAVKHQAAERMMFGIFACNTTFSALRAKASHVAKTCHEVANSFFPYASRDAWKKKYPLQKDYFYYLLSGIKNRLHTSESAARYFNVILMEMRLYNGLVKWWEANDSYIALLSEWLDHGKKEEEEQFHEHVSEKGEVGIKTNMHKHPLKREAHGSWHCNNGKNVLNTCRSGGDGMCFNDEWRWRCEQCDYNLCVACLLEGIQIQVPQKIFSDHHEHALTKRICSYKGGNQYYCDMGQCGDCHSGHRYGGDGFQGYGWSCVECGFDICYHCAFAHSGLEASKGRALGIVETVDEETGGYSQDLYEAGSKTLNREEKDLLEAQLKFLKHQACSDAQTLWNIVLNSCCFDEIDFLKSAGAPFSVDALFRQTLEFCLNDGRNNHTYEKDDFMIEGRFLRLNSYCQSMTFYKEHYAKNHESEINFSLNKLTSGQMYNIFDIVVAIVTFIICCTQINTANLATKNGVSVEYQQFYGLLLNSAFVSSIISLWEDRLNLNEYSTMLFHQIRDSNKVKDDAEWRKSLHEIAIMKKSETKKLKIVVDGLEKMQNASKLRYYEEATVDQGDEVPYFITFMFFFVLPILLPVFCSHFIPGFVMYIWVFAMAIPAFGFLYLLTYFLTALFSILTDKVAGCFKSVAVSKYFPDSSAVKETILRIIGFVSFKIFLPILVRFVFIFLLQTSFTYTYLLYTSYAHSETAPLTAAQYIWVPMRDYALRTQSTCFISGRMEERDTKNLILLFSWV